MADRELRAEHVVGYRRRDGGVVGAAVDEHDRHPECADLARERFAVERRGRRDQAVHELRAHCLELAALALRRVVGVPEQDRVALLAEALLDAPHDRRDDRVADVGDDHADRA